MIGPEDFGMDAGAFQPGPQGFGGDEVVDAPARVVLAGAEAVAPPAVSTGHIGIEETEGVRRGNNMGRVIK